MPWFKQLLVTRDTRATDAAAVTQHPLPAIQSVSRAFGHLQGMADALPGHLAILLPVTATSAEAPSILASFVMEWTWSNTFSRHIINLCKTNIAYVAQWHENFVFPPTAILEIQIDGGKKHQGRAQDALDEWHAIQPDIMAKSRQPGFQLTPHVMESHSLFH